MHRKNITALSWLILCSILLRLIVFFLLPPADGPGKYANSSELFFSALTTHLGEYLRFTTNIPPLSYLVNSLVFQIWDLETALHINAFIILVAIMDLAAICLLYHSALRLGAGKRITLTVFSIFSAALIPFELWREGMHYDQHTLFFTSLFAWSLVRLFRKDSWTDIILVSFAAMLLTGQSAANSVIVPLTILLMLAVLYLPAKRFGRFAFSAAIALLLPVILLLLLSKKNQAESRESLTSNKAGPAMMMVVQRAYNYDIERVRNVMQKAKVPDWYVWVYDHATVPLNRATGLPYPGWLNLSQAFGVCFYSAAPKPDNVWDFDFHPLLGYLRLNGHTDLAKAVEADSADAVIRPYLFSGYAPELSPRWIGIYGDHSKKVFFAAIADNSVGMVQSFIVQQGIFGLYGPLFPYNTIKDHPTILSRNGLRTINASIPLEPFFMLVTILFSIIAWITYGAVLLNIPVTIWKWLLRRKGVPIPILTPFLVLSFPVVLIALIFSCLVGGENDRYFMQLTPYLMILTCCLPIWFNTLRRTHR
jgi:hypothetical protein